MCKHASRRKGRSGIRGVDAMRVGSLYSLVESSCFLSDRSGDETAKGG